MTFTLLILGLPNTGQAVHSAYHFARAAILVGHRVRQAFFYADAALSTGTALLDGDEVNITRAWHALAEEHHIELVACATAATRRGIDEAREEAPHITTGTLAQLMTALEDSARVLTFAD